MIVEGTFQTKMTPEPPYETSDGISLGRVVIEKRFSGPLDAESTVHMTAARTTVESSAGYVAVERIRGTLEGRRGSFVVLHIGIVNRGAPSLEVTIVPDSGTDELTGISGKMDIKVVDGKHVYKLDYALAPDAGAKTP